MPCWYFEKKDLQKTPSYNDGINAETEAKYRLEGARFIMDAASKMKLHYNTCATGVVYFHRFYLFHSFKEFPRHVMAVCCLFLAGKVEETPKKCKDLIKVTQSMLTEEQFAAFGKDPREEVMTLERILLQTIKFDLMVEHPYAFVVKFAKLIKGDKAKIEKMAQMAWTFVNDSLCTTLCLQWESEVIAVAMMYLTSRLSKFEPVDWQGKPPGYRNKWYEFLVKDVTLELLEDICHQVLDLYSKPHLKAVDTPSSHSQQPPLTSADESTKSTPKTPISPQVSKRPTPGTSQGSRSSESTSSESSHHHPGAAGGHTKPAAAAQVPSRAAAVAGGASAAPTQQNPYVSSQMYSSSFMSGEGSKSIQSLISGGGGAGMDTRDNSYKHKNASANVASQHYQQDGSASSGYQSSTAVYQPSYAPPTSVQPPITYSQSYAYSSSSYAQLPSASGTSYNQNYPVQTGSSAGYASYDSTLQQYAQSAMQGDHQVHPANQQISDNNHRQHWQ